MKRIAKFVFVFGLALIAGGIWFGGNHLVIHTRDGMYLSPKQEYSLESVYVDTRQWNALDFLRHDDISTILLRHGYTRLADQIQPDMFKRQMAERARRILESVTQE